MKKYLTLIIAAVLFSSFKSCLKTSEASEPPPSGFTVIFDSIPVRKTINPIINETSGIADSKINKVGIDIEEIKDIPLVDFDNEFSKKELEKIYTAENSMQLFYTLWTQKEAFLKAIGTGLNVPLNKVAIHDNKIIWDREVWYLKEIKVDPRYISHLSTDTGSAAIIMKEIKFL